MSVAVNFVVTCETTFGTQLCVTGSDYALYNWRPILSIYCEKFPIWKRTIYFKENACFEYKFVKLCSNNNTQEWESIPNRKIKLCKEGAYVITTSFNNPQFTIEYEPPHKLIEKASNIDLKENDILGQLIKPAIVNDRICVICSSQSNTSVVS